MDDTRRRRALAVGYRAPFVLGAAVVLPVLAIAVALGRAARLDAAAPEPTDPGHVR